MENFHQNNATKYFIFNHKAIPNRCLGMYQINPLMMTNLNDKIKSCHILLSIKIKPLSNKFSCEQKQQTADDKLSHAALHYITLHDFSTHQGQVCITLHYIT